MKGRVTIALYDDHCTLCTSFAHAIKFFAKDRIRILGLYSPSGKKVRDDAALGPDATEMFWLVREDAAFGGRAALWPLLKTIAYDRGSDKNGGNRNLTEQSDADAITTTERCKVSNCSGPKHAIIRSASLIRNSRTVRISAD